MGDWLGIIGSQVNTIAIQPDGKVIMAGIFNTVLGATRNNIARLNTDGTLDTAFGTPRYIAPEQAIASHRAVPQSDIYALGVVLFEMAAGQAPFDSDSPMTPARNYNFAFTKEKQTGRTKGKKISLLRKRIRQCHKIL